MAFIGDSCVYIGSPDWYIGDPLAFFPNAEVTPALLQYAQYHIARVDASTSYTEDPLGDVFYYKWFVETAPDGVARDSLLRFEGDEVATLPLDIVGLYTVRVQVIAANGGCSAPSDSLLLCQPATVATTEGQVLPTEWLWEFLPDFWGLLDQRERDKIETLWRGMHQLVAADSISALNARDASSIATIQEHVIRRWVPIDLALPCASATFYLQPLSVLAIADANKDALNMLLSARATLPARAETTINDAQLYANGRVVLLGVYDAQPADVGGTVTIGGETRKVTDIVGVGTRFGLVVGQAFSVGDTDVVATVRREGAGDVGIAYDALLDGAARVSASSDTLTFDGRITHFDQDKLRVTTQLRIDGAELRGVSVGDVLDVTIERADIAATRTFPLSLEVVGVSGDYVAVSLLDVADGTDDATTLQNYADVFMSIVEAAVSALEGVSQSTADAQGWVQLIKSSILNTAWRARFFYSWVSGEDVFEFGDRSVDGETGAQIYRAYRVRPVQIARRARVPLPQGVSTIYRLSERTEPYVIVDGEPMTITGETLPNTPSELFQNRHFSIRIGATRGVGLRRNATVPFLLQTDRFDFRLSRTEIGDSLRMDKGPSRGVYTIIGVTSRAVFVSPTPPNDFYNQPFSLIPNVARGDADVITFVRGVVPAHVRRYWAEVAIVENNQAVEAQFGHLVGLRLDEWAARGLTNSYKDAVAGIMFARMYAPTVANIRNAASLLAGVPFAHKRSRVSDIFTSYEIDERTGEDLKTRISLSELDDDGNEFSPPRLSAHVFPSFRESDRDPEFSGIARGSDGLPLRVGSIVEQYTAIALGVKLIDLYTADAADLSDVRDRHRFRLLIDVDAVDVSAAALRLIYDFTIEIKPAYTEFLLRLRKFLVDYINIDDDVFFRLRTRLFDNPYHAWPQPNIQDAFVRQATDSQQLNPLTTWFPSDGIIARVDEDLLLTSALGGFVDPRGVAHFRDVPAQDWPQPWIQPGDVLVRRDNRARLVINNVVDDHTLQLTASATETDNLPAADVRFYIARPMGDPLFNATIQDVTSDERVEFALIGYVGNHIGIGDFITLEESAGGVDDATGMLRVIGDTTLIDGRRVLRTLPNKPPSINGKCLVRVFHERAELRIPDVPVEGITVQRISSTVYAADRNLACLGIAPGVQVLVNGNATRVAFLAGQYISFENTPLTAQNEPHDRLVITRPVIGAASETVARDDSTDVEEIAVDSAPTVRIKGLNVKVSLRGRLVVVEATVQGISLLPGDILVFKEQDLARVRPLSDEEGRGVMRVGPSLGEGVCWLPCVLRSPTSVQTTAVLLRQPSNGKQGLFVGSQRDGVVYGDWVRVFTRDIQ